MIHWRQIGKYQKKLLYKHSHMPLDSNSSFDRYFSNVVEKLLNPLVENCNIIKITKIIYN